MLNKKTWFSILLVLCVFSFAVAYSILEENVFIFSFETFNSMNLLSTKETWCIISIVIPVLTIFVYSIIRSVQKHSEAFIMGGIFAIFVMCVCNYSFVYYIISSLIMGCLMIFVDFGSSSGSDRRNPYDGWGCSFTSSSGCC